MNERDSDRAHRRPLQQRSAATVRRIEDAALRLLSRGIGLDAITTQHIAAEAGVSVGGLYRFFPDKQAIVDAIALRRLAAFEDAIGADIRARPRFASGAALVSHIIALFARYLRDNPDFRTMLYGANPISDHIRERHFGHDARSAVLARRYVTEVLRVADTPALALRWRLVGEIAGKLIGFALDQPDAEAAEVALAEVTRLVVSYLFGADPGRDTV